MWPKKVTTNKVDMHMLVSTCTVYRTYEMNHTFNPSMMIDTWKLILTDDNRVLASVSATALLFARSKPHYSCMAGFFKRTVYSVRSTE